MYLYILHIIEHPLQLPKIRDQRFLLLPKAYVLINSNMNTSSVFDFKFAVTSMCIALGALSKLVCEPNPESISHTQKRDACTTVQLHWHQCQHKIAHIQGSSQTFQNEGAARGAQGWAGGLTGTQIGSSP